MLPRPWDPTSIREPQLRRELWTWLDHVVDWLNVEYVWDIVGIIPPCWPQHPHLVGVSVSPACCRYSLRLTKVE